MVRSLCRLTTDRFEGVGEPHLRAGIAGAVFSADDHQVDNRQLALALKAAFLRAGGILHEYSEVTALDMEAGRARGVWVGDKRHRAEAVVLAAGPWTGALYQDLRHLLLASDDMLQEALNLKR